MEGWNKTELDSYLIEISANILQYQDEKGEYLVENIRDTAGQVSRQNPQHFSMDFVLV